MSRNRFENYISSRYESQFTPTPLDPNFMFNVQNARQEYFDKLQAGLLASNPQINFLRPNDFDMGHLQEANQYRQDINSRISKISDMMKKDDLTGATTELLGLKTDPNLLQKKQQLEYSFEQDKQFREYVDKNIKDPYYKSIALSNYEQNRLKDKPFSIGMSLNSPIIADKYDYQEAINKVLTHMEANGIPLGNGKVASKVVDENGRYIYQYVTEDGKLKQLTTQEVYDALSGRLMNDPELKGHIASVELLGLDEKEALKKMMIAAAEGKSFSDMTIDRNYISDQIGLGRAKGEIVDRREGFDYDPYTINEYAYPSNNKDIGVDKNGNLIEHKLILDPTYDTASGKLLEAGHGNESRYEDVELSKNHPASYIKNNFVKLKDGSIVKAESVVGPSKYENISGEEALDIYNARTNYMKSFSNAVIPYSKPVKLPTVPSHSLDETIYVRNTGVDGSPEFRKTTWGAVKDQLKDSDIYQSADISALNTFKDVPMGKVYSINDKDNSIPKMEIIMPDGRYKNTPISKVKDAVMYGMNDPAKAVDSEKIKDRIVVEDANGKKKYEDIYYDVSFDEGYFNGQYEIQPLVNVYNSNNELTGSFQAQDFLLEWTRRQLPEDE